MESRFPILSGAQKATAKKREPGRMLRKVAGVLVLRLSPLQKRRGKFASRYMRVAPPCLLIRPSIPSLGPSPAQDQDRQCGIVGYFDPGRHALQVGNNDIKAGILVNAGAMVPGVKILALEFHFPVRSDAKMLPSFLRCFPNVERLYIQSNKTTEPTGKLNFKFWQQAASGAAIEWVESHVQQLVFHDFRGEKAELAFLQFFVESVRALERLVVVCASGCFASTDEASSKVRTALFAGKKETERCAALLVVVLENATGKDAPAWKYERGSDFSRADPFAFIVPT